MKVRSTPGTSAVDLNFLDVLAPDEYISFKELLVVGVENYHVGLPQYLFRRDHHLPLALPGCVGDLGVADNYGANRPIQGSQRRKAGLQPYRFLGRGHRSEEGQEDQRERDALCEQNAHFPTPHSSSAA